MILENSFDVNAAPDRVFAFLLDVNRVAVCIPGAQLDEIVDATTFKGSVKVRVGPITVSYKGTARVAERDASSMTATLDGEGRETTGAGSAHVQSKVHVEAAGTGARVHLSTDLAVAGRVAQFGRGVMQDVSHRLVDQMAACIKAQLEASLGDGTELDDEAAQEIAQARPVNAISIFVSVLWDRIRRLFGRA